MSTAIKMNVIPDVSVAIIPNDKFEFLMTTKEVASGYDVTTQNIREHARVNDELIEGKHFIRGVRISDTLVNAQPHQVFWTKAGVVRLGFFIKSERAKLFRDWAENLILKLDEQMSLFNEVSPVRQITKKRNHNRITKDRLVELLADVCLIEDKELRERISRKLIES